MEREREKDRLRKRVATIFSVVRNGSREREEKNKNREAEREKEQIRSGAERGTQKKLDWNTPLSPLSSEYLHPSPRGSGLPLISTVGSPSSSSCFCHRPVFAIVLRSISLVLVLYFPSFSRSFCLSLATRLPHASVRKVSYRLFAPQMSPCCTTLQLCSSTRRRIRKREKERRRP